MHELQLEFATAEGEAAWEARLRGLFEQGMLDAAHAILESALQTLDSDFARQCLQARPDSVAIEGWEELVEAIQQHEGEPIAGVTLAVANEADRAFEKGQLHHPFMMLGLYTDEPYRFSGASSEELLDQTQREDGPEWAGYDEDIEVFLDIEGLDQLNTLLLHHKQRHFFRDGKPDHAPERYVEYVLGCWWRALLFQLAVTSESAIHGLPGGIPVIAGTVEMRPEIVMVHGMGASTPERERTTEVRECAPMLAADFIQIRAVEEEKEVTGADLRRKVAETGQEDEPAPRRSFMARLFGR
ncbi:hypothetical protein K3172_04090 [Qipengyuania sp. 6B39]|uniref:hypothetical protein n=1 Tax=Qipengyuania proteolytica TaxID=2867239 RepID=UPI001C8A0846|nr:hypothetical protein [Qipengyuania proteolytica]MBX7495036.1 hypothetical protein [Qipengyuania proteolytica]